MRSVFPSVAMVPLGHNYVLVESQRPFSTAAFTKRLRAEQIGAPTTGAALGSLIGNAQVLTDDFAPVDQLLT
jgi:hypothetical protein